MDQGYPLAGIPCREGIPLITGSRISLGGYTLQGYL